MFAWVGSQFDAVLNTYVRGVVTALMAGIAPIAGPLFMLFYGRLFEVDPSLRHMFRGDIAIQGRKLADMLAAVVFCFRDIDDGIEESSKAWEKRDYWMKEEEFRTKWGWTHRMSAELEKLILGEAWDELPALMVKLFPYFSEIKVNKITRKDQAWIGCYQELLSGRT